MRNRNGHKPFFVDFKHKLCKTARSQNPPTGGWIFDRKKLKLYKASSPLYKMSESKPKFYVYFGSLIRDNGPVGLEGSLSRDLSLLVRPPNGDRYCWAGSFLEAESIQRFANEISETDAVLQIMNLQFVISHPISCEEAKRIAFAK